MLPGPVFNAELITTARRRPYYVVRAVYGLFLLVVLWQNFQSWAPLAGAALSINQMARFGRSMFYSIIITQSVAVLLLTPALVAGAIADEKQRKTLHDLLASRLTSGEIVLGKLAARLLHVLVFLAVGFPFLSLLSLFGGVDPIEVALSFAGTLTTVYFLASLAILVSTYARRVRDAVSLAITLTLAWLIIPYVIEQVMPTHWPWIYYNLVGPVNDWIAPTSPLSILGYFGPRMFFAGRAALVDRAARMAGLQAAYGTLLILWAVWRLRPIFRRERGSARRLARGPWNWRIFAKPPVSDDPMLWKECHTSSTTGWAKLVGLLLVLGLIGVLAYHTFNFARPAFIELWENGFGKGVQTQREDFSLFLRIIGAALGALLMLGATATASAGLTAEREGDTWISLLATPLTGWEILRAKMIGPIWIMRGALGVLGALWLVGLASGALHPLGVLLAAVELVVFLWFGVASGTRLSLTARSTWRAQSLALALLLLANGGYLVCFCPIFFDTWWPYSGFGITPMLQGYALMPYREARDLMSLHLADLWAPYGRRTWGVLYIATPIGVTFYALGAAGLTLSALRRFDEAAGRPRNPQGPGANGS
ncbi:MAG: ABC transporter permease subunit [Isosphaeraceae bacterium]|nr:ABC transporter permease subunit [Isosphaeraceae bacterium]